MYRKYSAILWICYHLNFKYISSMLAKSFRVASEKKNIIKFYTKQKLLLTVFRLLLKRVKTWDMVKKRVYLIFNQVQWFLEFITERRLKFCNRILSCSNIFLRFFSRLILDVRFKGISIYFYILIRLQFRAKGLPSLNSFPRKYACYQRAIEF